MRPEPVQVQLIDDRPVRFVWRGRLYAVLSVIERPGGPAGDRPAGDPDSEAQPEQRDKRPAEWRCWRVTASPGKNVPAVPFTLCQDQVVDRWQLTRE